MMQEGPPLEWMLRRMTECPTDFWGTSLNHHRPDMVPDKGLTQGDHAKEILILVQAIACDHFRAMRMDFDATSLLNRLRPRTVSHCGLVAVITWLLHDEWFLNRVHLLEPMGDLICSSRLETLSDLVHPESFVQDPDRREELIRFCLAQLGCRPAGESVEQASDRLATLDSIERERVLLETREAEKRTREIREAMAQAKAMESASRYGE